MCSHLRLWRSIYRAYRSCDFVIYFSGTDKELSDTDSTHIRSVDILVSSGTASVTLSRRRPVFILGRNGTGKSALVTQIAGQLGSLGVLLPGSRPSLFDAESLNMTPAARLTFDTHLHYYNSLDSRWKPLAAGNRNEKAVVDLLNSEIQFKVEAANQIKNEGVCSGAVLRLQTTPSPLDLVNEVFAQANLKVQFSVNNGSISAERDGHSYSFARMSDGERSALVLVSEVVTAASGSVLVIDEPEKNLHPAISVSLIKTIINLRSDCGFVVSTHQLEIPLAVEDPMLVLVRSCQWAEGAPIRWDVDVIPSPKEIPESLWVDLVGARRRILFVEGVDSKSLDQSLYSIMFPFASIRSKESCSDVRRAVEGLRSAADVHRAEVYGLIDGDGMPSEKAQELEADGIYALSAYSVESLIYSIAAQESVAELQAGLYGISASELAAEAKNAALEALEKEDCVNHLAARRAAQDVREMVLSNIPKKDDLMSANSKFLIEVESPFNSEVAKLVALRGIGDLDAIISRYPVRESQVTGRIAKALKFATRADYEQVVLRRVAANSELRAELMRKLGGLAEILAA